MLDQDNCFSVFVKQVKTKNINAVPGKLFCSPCKAKFLLERDSLYWWSRQSSICYRYWQWVHWMSNTKEKASINRHFTCQLTRVYEIFKEQYCRGVISIYLRVIVLQTDSPTERTDNPTFCFNSPTKPILVVFSATTCCSYSPVGLSKRWSKRAYHKSYFL